MEIWQDQAIVLAARPHGESGAVVSLLTEGRGRHAGYMRGVHSSKNRGTLEPGNLVDANWQSRVESDLGTLTLELQRNAASRIMSDALRLSALQSACALCDAALPEREGHPGLFHGLVALMEALETDLWGPAYVMWEVAFLRELGFMLDLSKCAGGGDVADLYYVSPKTGRAVSKAAGEIYKERLLVLPGFLRPSLSLKGEGEESEEEEILTGLKLTGYFLEQWVFAHHTHGVPEARVRFQQRVEKSVDGGQ